MPAVDYEKSALAPTPGVGIKTFFDSFFRRIVIGDPDYYGPLGALFSAVGLSQNDIALFDLCRASFVEKTHINYKGGVESTYPTQYSAFVEGPPVPFPPKEVPSSFADWTWDTWLWERIMGTESRCIVALGHIAQNGILRLFRGRLAVGTFQLSRHSGSVTHLPKCLASGNNAWPTPDPKYPLSGWLTNKDWWIVSGTIHVDGQESKRSWCVLPIYHPSARETKQCPCDPGYQKTIQVLKAMRQWCNAHCPPSLETSTPGPDLIYR